MIPSVEEGKDLMLRVFAKELRAQRPGLTHARSFQLAQEAHPELREEFASETTAAEQVPYRYQPARSFAKPAKSVDKLSGIRQLMNQRVQADKKDDDGELMLVMASNGEIVGLELV